MPRLRYATEAFRGSQTGRARSANTRYPAGRPHMQPADRMYATDIRCQTDVRQHHRLMPPGRGHNNKASHHHLLLLQHLSLGQDGLSAVHQPSLSIFMAIFQVNLGQLVFIEAKMMETVVTTGLLEL